MRTRRGSAAAVLTMLASALWASVPAGVSAAWPSPVASAEPSERPPEERPQIQAWLDHALPTDAVPGSTLDVGATLWDPAGPEIPRMGATIFVQAVSPAGGGEPVRATAIRDWPGHYRANLVVPPGGLERIDVGIPGTVCENDVCRESDWLFDVAGTGPPPEAAVTLLADARIDIGSSVLVVGQPADLTVTVEPNADWDPFTLPSHVVVRAREPRGPNLATATLPLSDASSGRYEGSITIPDAGDLVLEAALDEDGGDVTRFGTSMTRVAVEASGPLSGGGNAGGEGSAAANQGAAGDEGLPPFVIALLAVLALAGIGVMVLGFRSGGR